MTEGSHTPLKLGFRMPAEWEPHAATWLSWPHHRTDFSGKLASAQLTMTEIARLVSRTERVRFIVADQKEQRRAARALWRAGVDLKRLDFFRAGTNRSWTRDYLPSFVLKAGRRRALGAVKWRFTGWARYPAHELDERAGLKVARHVCRSVWRPKHAGRPFVLEGGALDVDGDGSVLVEAGCLLTGPYARNPTLSATQTEQVLQNYLGVKKVIWVRGGIQGDDTSGHVDDFARFVARGKVVLVRERDRADANYRSLCEARESLEGARDARGRRIEVIELPMPQSVTYSGWRLPASYANFYIANGLVLVPTFNDPHDRQALGILAELFPEREVIGVYARDFVLGQGTIHCSTQQEPAAGQSASYLSENPEVLKGYGATPPGLSLGS